MTTHALTTSLLLAAAAALAPARAQDAPAQPAAPVTHPAQTQTQTAPAAPATGFAGAAADLKRQLEESLAELDALRARIAEEKIPLSRRLGELEAELSGVRAEYQQATRLLDSRTLDLGNLTTEIKAREDESTYLSNLLGEYARNFESRLHIAELQRYEAALEASRLALENPNLTEAQVYEAQIGMLSTSLDRLYDALGGARFDGTAVDAGRMVRKGTFLMLGPVAVFRSVDGNQVGTVEQRLGSLEPTVVPFGRPEDALAAAELVANGQGSLPVDPTLGSAHKMEATQETLLEHVQKGGPVMIPIFVMAAAALLVALLKWISLAFVRKPSRKKVDQLLEAVSRHDDELIEKRVRAIKGPVGRMLSAGVEHLHEPRELVEEVMYETVLTTRLRLERFLPFIAICASAAPLLGLLGTVTGIINTFKLITVFGSGDVKTLSGGISEALITTEYGLIVAIPSLLLHAFLSRKARGIVSNMETAAVSFVNQVSKTPFTPPGGGRRRDDVDPVPGPPRPPVIAPASRTPMPTTAI